MMNYNELKDFLENEIETPVLVSVNNLWCDRTESPELLVYSMEEFVSYMDNALITAGDLARRIMNGSFIQHDDWFMFDDDRNLRSYNERCIYDLYEDIDMDGIIDDIAAHPEAYAHLITLPDNA